MLEQNQKARLLKIVIGEKHKLHHKPLYEHIVEEARKDGLSGATVYRGIMGFGAANSIKTAKFLDLSSDLPMIIEMVDTEEKLEGFLKKLDEWFEASGSDGLVTLETLAVIRCRKG